MNIMKFYERIDKFGAWNLWRVAEHRWVDRWDHALKWWAPVDDPCLAHDLAHAPAFRPIDINRVRFLQRFGV